MALRLSAYINYVKNEPKMQKKSELSVESDFVCRFVYDKEEKHIEARVRSSYKDCTYSVTVSWLSCVASSNSDGQQSGQKY